jgi:hypothetical protein
MEKKRSQIRRRKKKKKEEEESMCLGFENESTKKPTKEEWNKGILMEQRNSE